MYVRSCWSRCLDSSILMSTKMYQLLLPCQVIYPFVKQQGLPQQGQSMWKNNRRFSPTSHARGNGQAARTAQHFALPSCPTGCQKSCCWISERPVLSGTIWKGETAPPWVPADLQAKADAPMPRPLRSHFPRAQEPSYTCQQFGDRKPKHFQNFIPHGTG